MRQTEQTGPDKQDKQQTQDMTQKTIQPDLSAKKAPTTLSASSQHGGADEWFK